MVNHINLEEFKGPEQFSIPMSGINSTEVGSINSTEVGSINSTEVGGINSTEIGGVNITKVGSSAINDATSISSRLQNIWHSYFG